MDYSTLRIFGCSMYSLVDNYKKNKLDSKFKKCIFIEFTKGVKGFKLWDLETSNVFTYRDVVFDKELMLQDKSETEDRTQGGASDSSADTQKKRVEFSDSPKRPDGSEEDFLDLDGDEHESTQEQPRSLRQSIRVTAPPISYGWEDNHVSFALVT